MFRRHAGRSQTATARRWRKIGSVTISSINFPTPLDFSDAQALSFAKEKIDEAGRLIGRRFRISDEAILRHYRNRGIMPFEIAQNLNQQEYEKIKGELAAWHDRAAHLRASLSERESCWSDYWLHRQDGAKSGRHRR